MASSPPARPRILVSPDKFKGTMSAPQAAAAIEAGIGRAVPDAEIRLLPIVDGGEGTVDAVLVAGATAHVAAASDPLGRPLRATWARLGGTAIVELAAASGLSHVDPTDETALRSDTFGTGQLLLDALDHDPTTIVVGLGGSAGTTVAPAYSARWAQSSWTTTARVCRQAEDRCPRLARVDLGDLDPRALRTPFVLCCDVSSPLLGESGAANVFGPQKGAGPATRAHLEVGLTRLAELLAAETGRDAAALGWGGAAGGSAAGLHAALGATFRQGIDEVAELLEFDAQLEWADILVVGEGSLDEQSMAGKAPIGLAERALRSGRPAVAVCGRIAVSAEQLRTHGVVAASSAADMAGSVDAALAEPHRWTAAAAEAVIRAAVPIPDGARRRRSHPHQVPETKPRPR